MGDAVEVKPETIVARNECAEECLEFQASSAHSFLRFGGMLSVYWFANRCTVPDDRNSPVGVAVNQPLLNRMPFSPVALISFARWLWPVANNSPRRIDSESL